MPNGRGRHKSRNKKRATKVSKGLHAGAKRHRLTEVGKALLGKGVVASTRHVPCKSNYKGTHIVHVPYNAAQAEENKRLYPHLFPEDERNAA